MHCPSKSNTNIVITIFVLKYQYQCQPQESQLDLAKYQHLPSTASLRPTWSKYNVTVKVMAELESIHLSLNFKKICKINLMYLLCVSFSRCVLQQCLHSDLASAPAPCCRPFSWSVWSGHEGPQQHRIQGTSSPSIICIWMSKIAQLCFMTCAFFVILKRSGRQWTAVFVRFIARVFWSFIYSVHCSGSKKWSVSIAALVSFSEYHFLECNIMRSAIIDFLSLYP